HWDVEAQHHDCDEDRARKRLAKEEDEQEQEEASGKQAPIERRAPGRRAHAALLFLCAQLLAGPRPRLLSTAGARRPPAAVKRAALGTAVLSTAALRGAGHGQESSGRPVQSFAA